MLLVAVYIDLDISDRGGFKIEIYIWPILAVLEGMKWLDMCLFKSTSQKGKVGKRPKKRYCTTRLLRAKLAPKLTAYVCYAKHEIQLAIKRN